MRQIVLDTETTGLDPLAGHRIIEIGCIELVDRKFTGNNFHCYLNPGRDIDEGAMQVHGITNEFLADRPGFADIAEELQAYIRDAELIIHNAPFDVGFLDAEFALLGEKLRIAQMCRVLDTLVLARSMYPGQRNSLDALCRRYDIDNSHRELHGALLDAEILADVYLRMTGGQKVLGFADAGAAQKGGGADLKRAIERPEAGFRRVTPTAAELEAHQAILAWLDKKSGRNRALWRDYTGDTAE